MEKRKRKTRVVDSKMRLEGRYLIWWWSEGHVLICQCMRKKKFELLFTRCLHVPNFWVIPKYSNFFFMDSAQFQFKFGGRKNKFGTNLVPNISLLSISSPNFTLLLISSRIFFLLSIFFTPTLVKDWRQNLCG